MTETKSVRSGASSRINKRELVRKVKSDLVRSQHADDITVNKINAVLDATVDSIMLHLRQGKEIFWSGMGSFVIQKRKPTMRRNPQNGQEIKIPSKEVVKMKLFKSFTDKCMTKSNTKRSSKK